MYAVITINTTKLQKKSEELADSNVNITTKVTQKPHRTIEKERY